MGKRLYYGKLLKAMDYRPLFGNNESLFSLQLFIDRRLMGIYEGGTPDEVITKVKADGYQVWGNTPLDYAGYPHTALEYILQKSYLIHEYGLTEDEAIKELTLKRDTTETE